MVLRILSAANSQPAVELTPEQRRAYVLLLLTAGTLVAVFTLTLLVARMLRRYRQGFLSEPRKPTPSDDVWSRHRLPEEGEEENRRGDAETR